MWGQGVMLPVLDPHLITGHKFMNLLPKGERHLFLNTITWFITLPNCSILRDIPFLSYVVNLPTPVLLWEGVFHRQFHKENNHGNTGSFLI